MEKRHSEHTEGDQRIPTAWTIIVFSTIIALSILPSPVAALQWSEALFNPMGDDNGKEFVELVDDDGNASLEGCAIRDSASGDALILLHLGVPGNRVIMVLENESILHAEQAVMDAAVYVVGSAIGNGLGNSADSLTISCAGTALLYMAYNASSIDGNSEGRSIVYAEGAWRAGTVGGTPGAIGTTGPDSGGDNASGSTNSTTPLRGATGEPEGDDTDRTACNESLQLLLGAAQAPEGGEVSLLLLSPSYASFEARAEDGTVIAAGDNLRGARHTFIAPNTSKVRVVAFGVVCGERQRMSRNVVVVRSESPDRTETAGLPPPPLGSPPIDGTAGAGTPETAAILTAVDAGTTVATTATNDMDAAVAGTGTPQDAPTADAPAQTVTGSVIMDDDAGAVPWISMFGAVTLIVSCVVFLRVLRAERENDGHGGARSGRGGHAAPPSRTEHGRVKAGLPSGRPSPRPLDRSKAAGTADTHDPTGHLPRE